LTLPRGPGLRLLAVVALLLAVWVVVGVLTRPRRPAPPPIPIPPPPAARPGGYVFCAWNVENLFDDVDDPHDHDPDEDWFAENPEAVRQKLDRLAEALLLQNGGRGPDVLAVVEVESRRAAELLRETLNRKLSPHDHYVGLVHRDNRTGRRIEPAVLSRFPVRDDLTRGFTPLRILEAHIVGPEGAPLVVLACHWTSRIRDGSVDRRAVYAEAVYRAVAELTARDPRADVLVAGDFNDEPDDPSVVDGLRAVADADEVLASARDGGSLLLLNITARLKARGEGTYVHNGRREVFDQIVASPGLLDPAGWRVRPESVRVEDWPQLRTGRDGRPWRFGGPSFQGPRGTSDHFAVSVRLEVGP
jgi:hypothetical protein